MKKMILLRDKPILNGNNYNAKSQLLRSNKITTLTRRITRITCSSWPATTSLRFLLGGVADRAWVLDIYTKTKIIKTLPKQRKNSGSRKVPFLPTLEKLNKKSFCFTLSVASAAADVSRCRPDWTTSNHARLSCVQQPVTSSAREGG